MNNPALSPLARLVLGAVATALTLTACTPASQPASAPAPAAPAGDPVAALGLQGLDARAAIEKLDRLPIAQRDRAYKASIRPHELIVSDGKGAQQSLPIAADQFYVSIAPYQTKTHECFYHSLTTCLGEMRNTEVKVTVTDQSGKAIVDRTVKTYDNGFVGFWLPRDLSGTLTLEANGKKSVSPIATGEKDPTCVTTTQLT